MSTGKETRTGEFVEKVVKVRRCATVVKGGRRFSFAGLVVVGNGFLRHMVRNIAGTLVQVGHGRRPEAWVGEVLAARDRHAAGPTAPAHALTLAEVIYGDGPAPWKDDGAD